MYVKAWNNGKHLSDGNGYGIKIRRKDRDVFFKREWKVVLLELEGEAGLVEVNIDKNGFWNSTCRELISSRIGKWLIINKLTPWTIGHPPRLSLILIEGNRFRLLCIS